MGVRSFSACVVVAAAVAAAGSIDASAVVGGQAIAVRSAPWAVSLRGDLGAGYVYRCTGVIVDPLHVLTAAHCLFNTSGLLDRSSQITITAGVSNFGHARASDQPQVRNVASVRFMSGYVWSENESVRQQGTDVAVVRLTRPLDLNGPDARAVALPTVDAPRPSGAGFELAGFGDEHASQQASGALELMSSVVIQARLCSSPRTLCGVSTASSICPGDSGAGLIRPGPVPTLVGVAVTGTGVCVPGKQSDYVDVAAPVILHFIEHGGGSATPAQPPATRWVPAGWLSQPWFSRNGAPLPLLVSLPRSWISGTSSDGTQAVGNPLTQSDVSVYALGAYTSWSEFVKTILNSASATLHREYPGAVERSRIVELPGGSALEVIESLSVKSDGREYSIENYDLLHEGEGYDVEYQGLASMDGADLPVWHASARTIHFIVNG